MQRAATQTIPIVFTANGDPISEGLVASLRRPEGNVTGITIFGPAAVSKRVQLMHQLVPQATTIAYLMNPKPSKRRNRTEGRTDGCPFSQEGSACL